MTLREIEREIQQLDASGKSKILRLLISDLDKECDKGIEGAWLKEVQCRYQELHDGKAKGRKGNRGPRRMYLRFVASQACR